MDSRNFVFNPETGAFLVSDRLRNAFKLSATSTMSSP